MPSVFRAVSPGFPATAIALVTAAAVLAPPVPTLPGRAADPAARLAAAALPLDADPSDLAAPALAAGSLADSVMDGYSAAMPWGELAVNVVAFGAASFIGGYLATQLIDNPFDLFFAHPYPTDPGALDPVEQAVFQAGYWLNDETLFPTNNPPHVDGALGILPSLLQETAKVLDGTSLDTAWAEFTQNLNLALQTWLPFVGTGQPVTDDPGVSELAAQALTAADPTAFDAAGAELPGAALALIP